MASTFTTRNRLTKQANNENSNTWGTIWNLGGGSDLLDFSLDGVTTVALSATNYVLTTNTGASDEARARVLRCTGTLAANVSVIIPNVEKNYLVYNGTSGAFTVSIKTASGSPIVIPQDVTGHIWCDGSDSVRAVSGVSLTEAEGVADATVADHNVNPAAHYAASTSQRGFVRLATSGEAAAGTDALTAITPATLKSAVLNLFFPVGTIYTTVVDGFSPSASFGGTWANYGTGRVLAGKDAAQAEFATVGLTGGAKTHTLSTSELPFHAHNLFADITGTNNNGAGQRLNQPATVVSGSTGRTGSYLAETGSSQPIIQGTGSGAAHNNLQPYIVVKFWQRTA